MLNVLTSSVTSSVKARNYRLERIKACLEESKGEESLILEVFIEEEQTKYGPHILVLKDVSFERVAECLQKNGYSYVAMNKKISIFL